MSAGIQEHYLEDSAGDSPNERRASGFTAVNGLKETPSDGRSGHTIETTGALRHSVQPPYAPMGLDQRREDWTTAQLSPVSQKRKRSISMERSPRSQTTSKRRNSSEGGVAGLYAGATQSHTGEQIHHFTELEASQTQIEALAAAQSSGAQPEAWANRQEQQQHQQQHPDVAHLNDAQLAAVLQRETQLGPHSYTLDSLDASPKQRFPVTDATQQQNHVEGVTPITPGMEAPHLQKQRKRNFSNRTKTGCLTCRERKKKCDEGKPTCNNCERGGFLCKGYSQQAPIYKPPTASYREPPALQSKNGYVEAPGAYNYPSRSMSGEYYAEAQQVLAATTGQASVEETREQSTRQLSSPQEAHNRSASARPPWPETGRHSQVQAHQVQYSPEAIPRTEYSQTPRMPELSRELSREQKKLPPPTTTTHSSPQRRNSSLPPQQYNDQRITAQLALQHPSVRPTPSEPPIPRPGIAMIPIIPTAPVYTSEKEKMLGGQPYQHSDMRLKRERYQCSIAVHEFNKIALNPNAPNVERTAHFRQILQPLRSPSTSPNSTADLPDLAGHIGELVEIAAPFACDYGYNIRIEDDVEISSGCKIIDACPVFIGARTFIGPDVSIYTVDGDHHRTPPLMPGLKRPCVAAPVMIEEDCWIGGHVIITRGVTIGKGSTIGAGTLVNKDVPSFTTVHAENSLRVASLPVG